jgi:hypothetical protein
MRNFRREHFKSDKPFEFDIFGEKDFTHSPGTES